MKKTLGVLFVLSLLVPFTAHAQDVELATYTPEQRWERASNQLTLSWVAGIAYAKSIGQTPADYAKSAIRLFVPGWGEPGTGRLNVVVGMHRNYMMFTESEFELVDQSETSVTVRSNRPWMRYFGEDEVWYGVTVAEYEEVFRLFNAAVAEHLALSYEESLEGGWVYMKFSR